MWTQSRRHEVHPLGHLSSRAGVITDRGLDRLIARAGPPSRIEELAIPFTAVTMDLLTGLRISGPGLYRVNDPSATSAGPGETSTSSLSGVGL